LTSANHVFLLDPWWNPATEDQAIDRVHRLGQTKPVEVVRFICTNSVEEKILELQNTKREMTTTALSKHTRSREDQQQERLQELMSLFTSPTEQQQQQQPAAAAAAGAAQYQPQQQQQQYQQQQQAHAQMQM
jgi:hypothetical protein